MVVLVVLLCSGSGSGLARAATATSSYLPARPRPPRGSLAYALHFIFPGCQHAPVRRTTYISHQWGMPHAHAHVQGLQVALSCTSHATAPALTVHNARNKESGASLPTPCINLHPQIRSDACHCVSLHARDVTQGDGGCEGPDARWWRLRGKSTSSQHHTPQQVHRCLKREVHVHTASFLSRRTGTCVDLVV